MTFDVFDISQVVKQYLKNSKDLDKDYYFWLFKVTQPLEHA